MAYPRLDELEKMTNEQLADVFGKMDLEELNNIYDPISEKDLMKRRNTVDGERTLQMRNKVLYARKESSGNEYNRYFEVTKQALRRELFTTATLPLYCIYFLQKIFIYYAQKTDRLIKSMTRRKQ